MAIMKPEFVGEKMLPILLLLCSKCVHKHQLGLQYLKLTTRQFNWMPKLATTETYELFPVLCLNTPVFPHVAVYNLFSNVFFLI